jgi:hypothetical protein
MVLIPNLQVPQSLQREFLQWLSRDMLRRKKKTLFAGKDEVDMYFSGISPVEDGFDNPLG